MGLLCLPIEWKININNYLPLSNKYRLGIVLSVQYTLIPFIFKTVLFELESGVC